MPPEPPQMGWAVVARPSGEAGLGPGMRAPFGVSGVLCRNGAECFGPQSPRAVALF